MSDGGIYPADTAAEAALSTPPSYFANQPDFWTLAKQYAAEAATRHLGPGRERRLQRVPGRVRQRRHEQGRRSSRPLSAVQSAVVNDMKKSGFTVAAG